MFFLVHFLRKSVHLLRIKLKSEAIFSSHQIKVVILQGQNDASGRNKDADMSLIEKI